MKRISILVLLVLVATGAFAQEISMSAGGGLLFDYNGNNGIEVMSVYAGVRNLSFGAYGFFDATYVEASLYFAYGSLSDNSDSIAIAMMGGKIPDGSLLQLGFELLGKYPFDLGGFTLFPLLGISYNLGLSLSGNMSKGSDAPSAMDLSQFGFLLGAGLDYPFSNNLFLRSEILFHIRLATKAMKDNADDIGSGADATIGMGPRIKVGVGYKF